MTRSEAKQAGCVDFLAPQRFAVVVSRSTAGDFFNIEGKVDVGVIDQAANSVAVGIYAPFIDCDSYVALSCQDE